LNDWSEPAAPEPFKQPVSDADFNDIFSSLDDFIPQTQRQLPQTQTQSQRQFTSYPEKKGRLEWDSNDFQMADWLHVLMIYYTGNSLNDLAFTL